MSNLHRLAWIDSQIHNKQYPNSRTIAERFEISQRQAQRDIEYLRYSMNAPVEYSTDKNGYYYTDQAYMLPSRYISVEEKQVLTYLANQYKMSGDEDARRIADFFSKLGGEEESGSFGNTVNLPVFNVEYKEAGIYNALLKAIDKLHKVKMTYINARGEAGVRLLHPYKIFEKDRQKYTAGFCELRNEIRIFKLSRIKKLELSEEVFAVSPFFNSDDYGSQMGFEYKKPYTATVILEKQPEPEIFKLKACRENGNIYKISFYNSNDILTALLSSNSDFTILSPNWLKERLKEKLNGIFLRNFDSDIICRTLSI
jgi:predicted DNA-binding transcriptional regulator YafY